MKALKYTLFLLVMGLGATSFASTDELVTSMKKQQRLSEKQIVDLWSSNHRGKELEQVLSEYVVREVRLRSISGTNKTGTLLSTVLKGGKKTYKDPQALAQALVLENLRRKGIHTATSHFVSGRYLMKNLDISVVEE